MQMAQIDQTFVFGTTGATTEVHAGNTSGSPGVNPKGPADSANPLPPRVQAPGGTILNKTVGSTKIVNPA
jgi:hypothetical protein